MGTRAPSLPARPRPGTIRRAGGGTDGIKGRERSSGPARRLERPCAVVAGRIRWEGCQSFSRGKPRTVGAIPCAGARDTMTRRFLGRATLVALALLLLGPAPGRGQEGSEKKFEDFDKVVKGARESDGLFKLHRKEDK